MPRTLLIGVVVALASIAMTALVATPGLAQLAPAADAPSVTAPQRDALGRTTPRGAIQGYLDAVAADDLERAARYLDIGPLSQRRAERLVRDLRTVLDRSGELLPTPEIANVAEGRPGDGLDPDLDRIGRLGAERVRTDLLMRRVEREGVEVWLVAAETLDRLPALVAASRASPVERWTPRVLSGLSLGGIAAGDWIALVGVAVLALLAGQLVAAALVWIVVFAWTRTGRERRGRWLRSARVPFGLLIAVAGFKADTAALGVSVVAREFTGRWADIVAVVALVWLVSTVIDHASSGFLRRVRGRTQQSALSVVKLVRRVARTVLVLLGLVVVLDILGVDVTTGLAALGIGGLALALGAQRTIENLVGSVTLVADQPIRIGDFCRFGATLGTVEDIGMRSTRIRTLEHTLITIPNGAFSSMEIENYAKRERFLFKHVIGMRYETTPDEIERVRKAADAVLRDDPHTIDDTVRVRFVGLGVDSLSMELFAYAHASDWSAFLEVQERLLLAVMRAFERENIDFAFPSQTVYLGRDRRGGRSVPSANTTASAE